MVLHNILYGLIICIFFIGKAHGQAADPRMAKYYYQQGDYEKAIKNFNLLLKVTPGDKSFNKYIGLSYLESDIAPERAYDYLKRAYDSSSLKKNLPFYIAKALSFHGKYKEAQIYLDEYLGNLSSKYSEEAKLLKRQYEYAAENQKIKSNAKIINLGDSINSPYPDFYPYVINDSTLIFSGRIPRKGLKTEFDGLYQSDVFEVNLKTMSKPTEIKKINTSLDEQVCGYYDNDLYVYYDHIDEYGNIDKYSVNVKYGWRKDRDFTILSEKKHIETSVFITKDGSKMFYTSDDNSGQGGYDIFMRNNTGGDTWGEPINLNLNTPFDEGFPYLTDDGKTIYFTSNGLPGYGGFDLYKATWNENGFWNDPENLGQPLNTASDEKFIWFTSENEAYISGFREGGYGYTDLYKVIFE